MAEPTSSITFRLLDGPTAADHVDELRDLHAEVYADPPYRQAADAAAGGPGQFSTAAGGPGQFSTATFAERFRVQRRQPGFVLAEARSGGYLVGYAAGMPLRPSTSWWRELTAPLSEEDTAEHPGRTFALTELLVRAAWRRQGIGRDLHDLILAGRSEERATAAVLPNASPAQHAFRSWGWRKIARRREPDSAVSDVLIRTPPSERHWS